MSRTDAGSPGGSSLDLVVVGSLAVLGVVFVYVPPLEGLWYLRVPLGVLLVLFLPGYAVVSALFPATRRLPSVDGSTAADPDDGVGTGGGIEMTGPTRLVIALGISAGGAPLVGMMLAATKIGVAPGPTLVVLAEVTVLLSLLASVRRRRVYPDQFGVSLHGSVDRLQRAITGDLEGLQRTVAGSGDRVQRAVDGGRDRETVLNVLLVAGLLVSMAGLGVAVATSDNAERYTEFYLLAEDPETGALVADAYPETVTAGEPTELHVGIANREGRTVDYTVVVQLERLEGPASDPTVTERARLDTVELTLREGRTTEFPHAVEPPLRGESLRLTYLLYVGEAPTNPGVESAHRSLHIWIDVVPPES